MAGSGEGAGVFGMSPRCATHLRPGRFCQAAFWLHLFVRPVMRPRASRDAARGPHRLVQNWSTTKLVVGLVPGRASWDACTAVRVCLGWGDRCMLRDGTSEMAWQRMRFAARSTDARHGFAGYRDLIEVAAYVHASMTRPGTRAPRSSLQGI